MASNPGNGARPVLPSADAWARVAAVVRRAEGSPVSRTPRPGRGPGAGNTPGWVAKVTSTISARSGSTYGRGNVRLQIDDGTSLSDDPDEPEFEVKSIWKAAIPVGYFVLIDLANGSFWVRTPGDCP